MAEVGDKLIKVTINDWDLRRGILNPRITELQIKEKRGYSLWLTHETIHGCFHSREEELDKVICEYDDGEYLYYIDSVSKDAKSLVLDILNEFKEDIDAEINNLQDIKNNIDKKYEEFLNK